MSEQELTKWKNKFRLYKTLHPDFHITDLSHCELCLHNKKCPQYCLMYIVHGDGVLITEHNIDAYSYMMRNHGTCVEWIKHV